MRRMTDRQRRAMFAELSGSGNISKQRLDRFANVNKKGISLTENIAEPEVPDWVTAPVQKPVQEAPIQTSDLDVLAEYAKTIPEEKYVVGAIIVDDEYAGGPVKLIVRDKVRKDLDDLLNV